MEVPLSPKSVACSSLSGSPTDGRPAPRPCTVAPALAWEGMGRAFGRVDTFHLTEESQHNKRQLVHRIILGCGVDPERIRQCSQPYVPSASSWTRLSVSRTVRPRQSRVWTTSTSPGRA